MLHPEDQENAAEQKVAAITGIEALGGGAKVSSSPPPATPHCCLYNPAVSPDIWLIYLANLQSCRAPPTTGEDCKL